MNDVNKAHAREVFRDIHKNIPREGPGDNTSTLRALAMCSDLPPTPRILDVGCGPGMQTIELARHTAGEILAVDLYPPYLDELRSRAEHAGVAERIRTVHGSMFDLRLEPASFNLIWAEGAIYIIGFEKGLLEWKRFLMPRGYLAVTHISWLSSKIPNEPRQFWTANYPAIRTVEENLRIASEAGYEVLGQFALPENAWWDDYYTPIEARLRELRTRYATDTIALDSIASTQEEIDLYRNYSSSYGYVFYVCRRTD